MHFLLSLLSIFLLQTQNSTLAIDLEKGRDARIVYYGSTVTDPAVFRNAGLWGQTAYPAYGLSGAAETAHVEVGQLHVLDRARAREEVEVLEHEAELAVAYVRELGARAARNLDAVKKIAAASWSVKAA